MTLNPTIDFGQLLVALTIIVSVVSAHFTIKTRLDNLEKKLDETVQAVGHRLDRLETSAGQVAGHVQRLIGRSEERPGSAGMTS